MFAKKSDIKSLGRLKKRSDFLCVQKQGNKWVAKGMVVEVMATENDQVRYGLTVSKKVSKSAVVRNRIKRRLRAVSMGVLPNYKSQSFDIVLIGRAETSERDFKDLSQDLVWCLKKLGFVESAEV